MDYALDLRNFHEGSHNAIIAPILIATQAEPRPKLVWSKDKLLAPIKTDAKELRASLTAVLHGAAGSSLDAKSWESSRYRPTPTIIEAALAGPLRGSLRCADFP
jgi:hypothetical protein